MSESVGAAVAEARRVLEAKSANKWAELLDDHSNEICRALVAADAALAAWERWRELERQKLQADEGNDGKRWRQLWKSCDDALDAAIRLTAEARAK